MKFINVVIDGSTIYSLVLMLLYHLHKRAEANRRITYTNVLIFFLKTFLNNQYSFFNSQTILERRD